jgi:hypothetical protein
MGMADSKKCLLALETMALVMVQVVEVLARWTMQLITLVETARMGLSLFGNMWRDDESFNTRRENLPD